MICPSAFNITASFSAHLAANAHQFQATTVAYPVVADSAYPIVSESAHL
jgi:hypothetical protein